ncbi:competence protein ComK [Tissierella sp.]|uniref:competence protein ComK n=1 Tax=Tissierella sp. TaxID=41274 RepID=UPI002859459E|nr:competence protein ComK [Tissierella sp.]MDR7857511.1 competence protein ComK [Tissierella sp.]
MEKIFNGELMAFIPQYVEDRGNCTIVYRKNMEPNIIEKTLKTVIRSIGKYYMIDLNEAKKRYRLLVSSPNLVPIPLSKQDVFVPIKVRVPICKGDGAFGYINLRYIDKIKKEKKNTIVLLSDGTNLKCLSSLATVKNHIRNGNIVSKCYENRSMRVCENEEIYNAMLPATKADIAMLRQELQSKIT